MTNHTSMSKFPSENDQGYRVVIDAIKGFLEFAPTRQLWKEVSMGRIRTVQIMLDLGADPNLQDIEGESALHKAVRCKGNAARVVETLVSRGADIDLKDIEQKTALSIAERESKDDIARFLRRNGATRGTWDIKKIGNEHPLDKIYMDGPSHSSDIEGRWDLEVLDYNCEDACRNSTLSISYFSQCASGTLDHYRSKTSVFDALYDKDSSKEIIGNALTKYQELNNMETKSALFTWYHLPANNVSQSIPN
jgi:ankyrin repeat protein